MLKEIEFFATYLKDERNLSNYTVSGYSKNLEHFFNWVSKKPQMVEPNDISNYISFLHSHGMQVATSNRALSAIKTFYKFLVRKGYQKNNPATIIECGKEEERLPRPVDSVNITKLINIADNFRDKVIFELLYACGARRAELVSIKVIDINFNRKCIRLFGKGNKERVVPLYPEILEKLKELINENGCSQWLFPSTKFPGQHLSNRRLDEIVNEWVARAGLSGMDITPHKFRHALATDLYEKKADIRAIQNILGHTSINTTNKYTKVSVERNRIEYAKLFEKAGN